MNCKGCWNYDKCENKDNPKLILCFKRHESICHYCLKENTCKDACIGMCLCSEINKKEEN